MRYILVPTILSGLLIGCMTPLAPAQVTRFHNMAEGEALPRGSIVVLASDAATPDSIEQRTYAAAVMRELQRVGYTDSGIDDDGVSRFMARVTVERDTRIAEAGRGPVSVGIGGGTGGYRSGVGVGVGMNFGGGPREVVATELSVRIADRATNEAIWEGRASVEAKSSSPAAQPGLAAAKLAEALFADFPGRSGETISVK